MMFLRSVVLGSAVTAAFAQTLVDDEYSKVHGATKKTVEQCPATTSHNFHHDGMQKDQRAEATFQFDPPRDGCYLIEERTELDAIAWNVPEMKKCEASANTKVHVHYSKSMQAVGTVDQTPKGFGRQPQDQWTFVAALQFYAGHPGNVTLSNEGTEPGTLTVFDQVRFSWSGKDCVEALTQPRRVEIRMKVDFELIADRLTIFGIALKQRLAEMAGIPEDSLRLTGLRSGSRSGIRLLSVIAEFLVLPTSGPYKEIGNCSFCESVVASGDDVGTAKHSIKRMGIALSVTENAAELCVRSGGPFTGCNVELNDLGFAMPTVKALPAPTIKASPAPVAEQNTPQLQEEQNTPQLLDSTAPENDTQTDGTADGNNMIIVVSAVAAVVLLLCLGWALALYRVRKAQPLKTNTASLESSQSYETKVEAFDFSIEESNVVEEKVPVQQDDDKSTVCPSMSDQQSACGDIENGHAHPYEASKA